LIKPLENYSSLPLNKQLVDLLIDELISNQYHPHDRFYTYREIAEKYKTSIITVKTAIQHLINMNMLYLKPRKGTFIKNTKIIYNPVPHRISPKNIIFICALRTGPTWFNPYYSIILNSLENQLEKYGYNIEIFSVNVNSSDKSKYNKLFIQIAQNQVAGIFLASDMLKKDFIDQIRETGIPMVLVDGPFRDKNYHHIAIDDVGGAKTAVEYLITKGHKNIGYLGVTLNNRASRLRLEGFKKALALHKIQFNEKWVITKKKKIHFETGFKSMKILLKQSELPTALFAINDAFAFGAIRAIRQNNLRIPEDISIIGFDDIEMSAHMHPSLTTMHVDRSRIGRLAADRIVAIITGKKIKEKESIIKPWLVERESVCNLNPI